MGPMNAETDITKACLVQNAENDLLDHALGKLETMKA